MLWIILVLLVLLFLLSMSRGSVGNEAPWMPFFIKNQPVQPLVSLAAQ